MNALIEHANRIDARFFFQCPLCLFRFTAKADSRHTPDVRVCAVCDSGKVPGSPYPKCLGATKGVLSMEVPCDTRCTSATGPNCTCSCGGKNHGSNLLAPVVRGIVDLSGRQPQEIDKLREDYYLVTSSVREVWAMRSASEKQAREDIAKGVWVNRGTFDRDLELTGFRADVWKSKTMKGRMERVAILKKVISEIYV